MNQRTDRRPNGKTHKDAYRNDGINNNSQKTNDGDDDDENNTYINNKNNSSNNLQLTFISVFLPAYISGVPGLVTSVFCSNAT